MAYSVAHPDPLTVVVDLRNVVVQDAQKHTLGIVTLENLLEELVGDIRDEHDDPAAATPGGVVTL